MTSILVCFLKQREWSNNISEWPRILLSRLIYKFTKGYVHTALVYEDIGILKVREMDVKGSRISEPFSVYKDSLKNRLTIVEIPCSTVRKQLYNKWCKNTKVKYDYRNLIFRKPLEWLLGKEFVNFNYKRSICSEDTANGINIAIPNLIDKTDGKDPNEVYQILTKYLSVSRYDLLRSK